MTNFLSPVDPIFFLHHSNMDRLWDVWTRKQKRLGLHFLPTGADLATLSNEPFLFYVNGKGEYVGPSKAGDYLSMERFDYDYEPGSGENMVTASEVTRHAITPMRAIVKGSTASVAIPASNVNQHLSATVAPSLIAEITVQGSAIQASGREFDVLVGAPADVTQVGADSPYYAGTIAFFGHTMNMTGMSRATTFTVPLPKAPEAFHNLRNAARVSVNIRIVPSHGHGEPVPALKAVTIEAR